MGVRKLLGRAALALWVGGGLVVGAALLALHVPALPPPAPADPRVAALIAGTGQPTWRAIHALYADCACSSRILDHLIARGPQPGFTDHVLLIGDAPRDLARARAAGIAVEAVDDATAARTYGIESAPLLLVADPEGGLRYLGGYTDRKQSLDIQDLTLIARAQQGELASTLPIIGCAVSARLKAWVDPLGLSASRPRS